MPMHRAAKKWTVRGAKAARPVDLFAGTELFCICTVQFRVAEHLKHGQCVGGNEFSISFRFN